MAAVLCGYNTSKYKLMKTSKEGALVMASERVLFWQKKLAENQQILDLIEAGQFQVRKDTVRDAQVTAEVREWATRRVAECVARIAEWSHRCI